MELQIFSNKNSAEAIRKESLCAEETGRFRRQLLIYTVLFVITALGVYLYYLRYGMTLLRARGGNFDGVSQTYPIYVSIKRYVNDFLAGKSPGVWSWCLGLGEDYIELFKSKLVDPLTYVIILFPEKYLDVVISAVTVFREYLTGVAFLLFAREMRLKKQVQIIGALSYAFSGWIVVVASAQGVFLNAAIVLPIMIMGIEWILKKRTPLLFIASVLLFFMSGVIWTYIGGIIALLYYFVRWFHYNPKPQRNVFLKEGGAFLLYGILGILVSSFFAISMFLSISGATTAAGYEPYKYTYRAYQYVRWLSHLNSITPTCASYTFLYMPVIFVMMLPLLVRRIRAKCTEAIFAGVLFLAALLPITGRIFNGMSYSTGRWFFVLNFFLIWACAECLDKIEINKKTARIIGLWLAFLLVWNVIVCRVILQLTKKANAYGNVTAVLIGFIILVILYRKNQEGLRSAEKQTSTRRKKIMDLAVLGLVMLSIMAAGNYKTSLAFNKSLENYSKAGFIYDNLSFSSQKVIQKLQKSDPSFFRTDQVEGRSQRRVVRVQVNENLYFDNRSIYMYFSTISRKWLQFNKAMGNNAGYFDRTTSFSNDNRAELDTLMGVKYFLGDDLRRKSGASAYAPYGFRYKKDVGGIRIYQNTHEIGPGTAFGKYITESELMKYSPLTRPQVLSQAAVIPDKSAGKVSGVHHAEKTEIHTSAQKLKYTVSNTKNVDLNRHSMTVKDKIGEFDLNVSGGEDCQLIVSFNNLKRKYCTPERRSELPKHYVRPFTYVNDPTFMIYASKGNVVKRTLYQKGKSQAITDIDAFNINLGYYKKADGTIHIEFHNSGDYTFSSLDVYAVPMNIYRAAAGSMAKNRYKVTSFSNDRITGTVDAEKDSVLFLSILDTTGWNVFVDGKKAERLSGVDIAFTGVKVGKGHHEITLKYHSTAARPAMILTIIGLIGIICMEVYRRKEQRK